MLAEMKSALAIEPKDYSGEDEGEGEGDGESSGTGQEEERNGYGKNGSPVVGGKVSGNSLTPEKYSKGRKSAGRQQSLSVNGKNKRSRPPLVDIMTGCQDSVGQMDVFEQFAKIQINEDCHGYFFWFVKTIKTGHRKFWEERRAELRPRDYLLQRCDWEPFRIRAPEFHKVPKRQ
jgi:hypothetical protein